MSRVSVVLVAELAVGCQLDGGAERGQQDC